jgi:hypothetical protein
MPVCYVCGCALKLLFHKSAYSFWACAACGVECIYPQPNAESLARLYGEQYDVMRGV